MNKVASVRVDQLESPIGALDIVWSDQGLHLIGFSLSKYGLGRTLEQMGLSTQRARASKTLFGRALERYFAGDLDALSGLPVVLRGTDFQLSVWRALREIPPGQTLGYGELAADIAHPGASRAVGSANGRNPIPLVIPCHRVIAAGGKLGGYGGGLDRKRWLLRHEGAAFADH